MKATIECTFSIEDAETLVLVLDHVRHQAETTKDSDYGIDRLCRKDCAARFRRLRAYIISRIPEKP